MRKMKWKRMLSGIMAALTIFSNTVPAMTAHAAEPEILLPYYEEVKDLLGDGEIVTASDIEIEAGTIFDVERDMTGIEGADSQKVAVKLHEAKNDKGENFDSHHADTYHAVYYVEPVSGNPSYQISRNIRVKEAAEKTVSENGTVSDETEETSEESEDAESDLEMMETEPVENKVEEPIIVGDGEVLFYPSGMKKTRSSGSATLEVGRVIRYPSNLGNYATRVFYVNGKIAYCVESHKSAPPSGDYAYEVLSGNENLQKALYYGYGGAGDATDEFMPQFDDDLKYVFTHLAASYFYCGMDAFHGCTMQDIIDCGVWGYIEFLSGKPEPMNPYISLSRDSLTASYDGTQQITDRITLNGDSRNYITVNLPGNVTFHNAGTGETNTGGTVKIYGGTSFYFTAPTSVTADWNTGELYGSCGTSWKAIVVKTSDNKQDIGSYYEESQRNSVKFSVEWLEIARVGVVKVDSKVSDAKLAGAVFGIYKDQACTQLIAKMPKTDKNGYAEIEIAKTQDTVYLKEITAPQGYRRNMTAYNVRLVVNETSSATVPDVEQMAELKIYKEGEGLSGADVAEEGVTFHYKKKRLSNAVYNVYAGEDILTAYGAVVHKKGDLLKENLKTDKDGMIVLKNLYLGTYLVKEIQAPENYVLNDSEKNVKLSYGGQEAEVVFGSATFVNDRQKAEVSVVKKDKETLNPLAGGVFGLYTDCDITDESGKILVKKDTLIEAVTTGTSGKAVFSADLPIGFSYLVKELQAPYGYYRNTEEAYEFTFSYTDSKEPELLFQHTFLNERVNAKIQLLKRDKEEGAAQGDATLEGAVYGLYASEDIVHPDGLTGVVYHAGEQIATLKTDREGKTFAENLYLGKYYVKETTASEGYLIDETEYELTCDYEGDLTLTVERSCTSLEQVKKQPFQLIKVSDNGEDTEAALLEGAGFTAYLKSSLSVKEDGSYDFASALPVVLGKNGETELFSDDKGHVVSIPIPYGTYVVVESTTPHNRKPIHPFEVKITEHKPTIPQVWRVFIDREFSAKLRIVKKDADTGMTVLVPKAEFKIFNMDTKKYVTMITTYPSKVEHKSFFTDADGDLILPEKLRAGRYRIEEVSAPDGYILNKNYVEVAVDTNTFYEIDPDTYDAVITVEYENAPAVGELTIEKKGEVLDGYKGGWFADSEDKEFAYKEVSLAGAKFKIYAAEDIFTKDMQTDENGKRTKYYSAGEFVADVITGEDGKAICGNLPMGQYKVVEVEAPSGYVLNPEEQAVTLVYVDDQTPVVYESMIIGNERQKVQITVLKKEAGTDKMLEGAEFGLFAKEDITDRTGKTIVKTDMLIERAVTEKTGKLTFLSDIPLGAYYVKELEAPRGYIKSEEIFDVDASYQGEKTAVITVTAEFENFPTKLEISKTDVTGEHELKGAVLSVISKDGKIIASWKSDGKPHMLEAVPVGEYILREEAAPYGYRIANEVKFMVESTKEIQKVSMKDELVKGKIVIRKTDEYTKKGIAGVEFEIRDKDGNVLATLVTDRNGYAESEELLIAAFLNGDYVGNMKYYVVETKAAEGYILDSTPHEVILKYEGEAPECIMYTLDLSNKPTESKLPQTGDEFNPWMFGGIGLAAILAGIIMFSKKRKKMGQK